MIAAAAKARSATTLHNQCSVTRSCNKDFTTNQSFRGDHAVKTNENKHRTKHLKNKTGRRH